MAERHACNPAPSESGAAGAPAALLPPYAGLPRDVISRQAASSRVSAGRDPWAEAGAAYRAAFDRKIEEGRRARTLVGGPLNGAVKTWLEWFNYEIGVNCPFGGDYPHIATALYDRHGRYVKTYCRSTDTGEELHDA